MYNTLEYRIEKIVLHLHLIIIDGLVKITILRSTVFQGNVWQNNVKTYDGNITEL